MPIPERWQSDPPPGSSPRIVYQDAELVAVDKPVGWLTHADGATGRPDVAGFLAALLGGPPGVHHRLDVDTSGVLVFSRSPAGARRLAQAFESGEAEKTYLAVVSARSTERGGVIEAEVPTARGKPARTRWSSLRVGPNWTLVEASPLTGRTHQIRLHFAARGAPVRGDLRYGDPLDVRAPRLLLHALRLTIPGLPRLEAPPPPEFARYRGEAAATTRAALSADPDNTCHRLFHGEADGLPGHFVDRYGDWLWVQHPIDSPEPERGLPLHTRGVYRIDTLRDRSRGGQAPPVLVSGQTAPQPLSVRENGIEYLPILGPHLSTGLFLDQRPQRAWVRANSAGRRVLNTFAHAGGFTVAAAVGGADSTVSIDLERDWLARIGPQLAANGLDADASHGSRPRRHDTIHGDVFEWLRRLAKRGEQFDLVILDPPSTSVGARGRRWSAAQHYTELVAAAAPLLAPGAQVLAITNHQGVTPARFATMVQAGLPPGSRLVHASAMPVDFPEDGPPSVKSHVWRVPG